MDRNLKIKKEKAIRISKFDVYIVSLLTLICFLICVFPINQLNNFYVFGDEFAMYSIGAFFNKLNWSGITSKIGYYSYGYPLIFIAPLFTFFKNFHHLYKASIIINCLLASALVPMSYITARKWGMKSFQEQPINILIILATVLNSYILVYSRLGIGEVLLMLLFFIITDIVIEIFHNEASFKMVILLSLLSVYIFFVHQRALGVLISASFFMIYMFKKGSITKKQFQIYFVLMCIFFLFGLTIKSHIQEQLWNGLSESKNDFGGVSHSIISIVTDKEIFFSFCRTIIGQFLYVGIASFGMVYCAIYYLIALEWEKIKTNKRLDADLIFILMSFVITFAVSAIFMAIPERADHFVYGRYNDIVYIVLVLYAFCNLSNIKLYVKVDILFWSIVLFLISSLLFKKYYSNMIFFSFNSPAFSYYINNKNDSDVFFLILIIGIYFLFIKQNGKFAKMSGIIIMIATAITTATATATENDMWINKKHIEADEILKVIDKNEEIYFLSSDDIEELRFVAYLQTEFPEKEIGQYKNEQGYLIVRKRNIIKPEAIKIKKRYVGETEDCCIFYVNNKENYFNLLDTDLMKTEFENGFSSSATKGFLFYGPYVNLSAGNYVANIMLKLDDALNDDIGFIDVVSTDGTNTIVRVEVKKTDFVNGKAELIIPFTLMQDVKDVEIRMYIYDDVALSAESLFLENSKEVGN